MAIPCSSNSFLFRSVARTHSLFINFPTLPVMINPCYVGDMKANSIVLIDPEIMSGTPCFAGTRVPARTLIDYIEGGDSLDDFLEDFPTVTRKQAVSFLQT
jgi:uncharacterized protein (DUF433 family)